MPFPLLPILAGLGSAAGLGATAYGVGTSIKDRRATKKATQNIINKKGESQKSSSFTPSNRQGSFWNGTPAGVETFNQYTPEQQSAINQILQTSLGQLGKNNFDFAPIEAQARQNFSQKTVPSIAERFTQSGSQGSSAFKQQLGAAGAGLESDLASMKSNYGLQQQQALQNLLGIGLKPQFESLYHPASAGLGQGLAQNLLTGDNIGNLISGIGGASSKIRDLLKRNQSNQQSNNIPNLDLNDINYSNPQNPLLNSLNLINNTPNTYSNVKNKSDFSSLLKNPGLSSLNQLYGYNY